MFYMKESLTIFLLGVTCGIFLLSVVGMLLGRSPSQLEEKMEKMRKEAISVGVGRYEVDTNGVVNINMKIKVTDIVYDTDIDDDSSDFVLNSELPSEMIVEVDGIIDIESEIADAISDTTGWCVNGSTTRFCK